MFSNDDYFTHAGHKLHKSNHCFRKLLTAKMPVCFRERIHREHSTLPLQHIPVHSHHKSTLRLPWLRFLLFLFLSYTANGRVKLAKMGHSPNSSQLVVICVVLCIVCV